MNADWKKAIEREATRRTFANLLCAEKWFRVMQRLGRWRNGKFIVNENP